MIHRNPILDVARSAAIGFTLIFLAACQPDTLLEIQMERIAEADAKLTKVRLESQVVVARSKEKKLAVEEAVESSISRADEVEAALQDARLELQTLEEEFVSYRNSYRTKLRADVLETTFPEVTLSKERTFKNFRIRLIENAEIHYTSNNSTGRIPFSFSDAPPEIASFLRLAEEAQDRAAFPELVPRRESDINTEAEAARSIGELQDLVNNPNIKAGDQQIREAKKQLEAVYENREKQLKNILRNLDKTRIELATKRRRHREYNEYHHTNIRDRSINKLSRSIMKIDQRSEVIYEKINLLRETMQKNR